MKVIGLVGGMSWESSAEYYRIINERINEKLGGLHSARINMLSIDFELLSELQHQEEWDKATKIILTAAEKIQKQGADFLVICSVTGHENADLIEHYLDIPLFHISDAIGKKIEEYKYETVGLLGTKFTMEKDFLKDKLVKNYGINIIVPMKQERIIIHKIIYDELCIGKIIESSKQRYKKIILNLFNRGAEAVILGCTEIPLLIKKEDCRVPLLDATSIHATLAADLAIKNADIRD